MSAQEGPEKPDLDKLIEQSIKSLDSYIHLDDVQLFFLDSIFQNNYNEMYAELELARQTGASNQDTYILISDKWMDRNDAAIKEILSDEQWAKYLKTAYGKEKKQREKRAAKRAAAVEIKKKK